MQKEIQVKLETLGITEYQNVFSEDLSGGNQRKLSMILALIGNPKVVLLDEPSTGMDPYSKRFMWRIISNLSTKNKETTVVFTTHSMEEAEFLSTRVGVMVEGNFKCLGTLERVKTRYAEGFFLSVTLQKILPESLKVFYDRFKLTPQQLNTKCIPQ